MQETNKTNALKRLDIRVTLNGQGGVNYDTDDQKWFLRDRCGRKTSIHENVNYLKKVFYRNENRAEGDPECLYNLAISADCIRHEIFRGCSDADSVLFMFDGAAVEFITSPLGFMRGYMKAESKTNGFGKKTCLSVTKAIDKNAVIAEELCSKSGDRDMTSLHYKENVGETRYVFEACFDVEQAQFLCLDDINGRIAVAPSYVEGENLYEKAMAKRYGRVPYKAGVYSNKTDVLGNYYGEYGYLFDDEYVNSLIKTALKQIFSINVSRATGWARTCKVEIIPVYDVCAARHDDDWTELKAEHVDLLDFPIHHFYREASQSEWEKHAEATEAKRVAEQEKRKEKENKKTGRNRGSKTAEQENPEE